MFFTKLSKLVDTLKSQGFVEEAQKLQKIAHYIPEEVSGVPSFWRRNYDYGEGFYCGDMSKKPGVKEWREQHKGKGPNMPKKKKEKKAQLVTTMVTHEPMEHQICPHCKDEIREKSTYYDGENWFHRPCMDKGWIIFPKKAVIEPLPVKDADPFELAVGTAVEKEHTDSEKEASGIARQHLREDPGYYEKLWGAGVLKEDEIGKDLWDRAKEKWGSQKRGHVDSNLKVEAFLDPEDLEILVEE